MNDKGFFDGKKKKREAKTHFKKNLNTDLQESTVRISLFIQALVFSNFKALDFGNHHSVLLRQLSSVRAHD